MLRVRIGDRLSGDSQVARCQQVVLWRVRARRRRGTCLKEKASPFLWEGTPSMDRKPFEAPVIKDEVSLVEGTLLSGGLPT